MANGRVIIVGGGIGGLTAAIACRRAGFEVTVFEASRELKEVGAGLGIQYGAMKALRELGLIDRVIAIGQPLNLVEMRSSDGTLLASIPHAHLAAELGVQTHNVHRGEIIALLADTIGREHIALAARCVGFDEDEDGVTARFEDGSAVRGDVLVAADGVTSTLRAQMLDDGPPRDSGIVCFRAIPEFTEPSVPKGVLRQSFGKGEFFAFVNNTEGRVFWFACALAGRGSTGPRDDLKPALRSIFESWAEPTPQLIDATDSGDISRALCYDRKPAAVWTTSRAALLGDAAHPMIPTLGQGGSAAIEDGVVLAKYLSRADLSSTASVRASLKAYEAERTKRTAALATRARVLGSLAMTQNPLVRAVRDGLLRRFPQAMWQRAYMKQHAYDVAA